MSKTKTPAPEAALEVRIDPAAIGSVLLPIGQMAATSEDPDPAVVDSAPVEEDPREPAPPTEGMGGSELPRYRLFVVDTTKGLNLRAGPGMEFEILEVLRDGSCVEEMTLLADPWDAAAFEVSVPGWALVRYVTDGAERAGWVDRRYLLPLFAEEDPG